MIRVESEIGRLRRVLVHRPSREIDLMVPSMMEELLFDDILDGELARAEHDGFRQVLESAGVEVFDAGSCLAEILTESATLAELFEQLERTVGLPAALTEHLTGLEPGELAKALVQGLRSEPGRLDEASNPYFDLTPIPNYFFQRDPHVVIGEWVLTSSMATDARRREPVLSSTLFRRHPALRDHAGFLEIHADTAPARHRDPGAIVPNLEGGDVLVASRETVLVGTSERTNQRGVVSLCRALQRAGLPFRNLILVSLPHRRSYMHLDTVFTFIDRDACLAYRPVIASDGPEAATAYHVDLTARELSFSLRPSLLAALKDVGFDLDLVPCGGSKDPVDEQREQWTDGANAFAVAPGVIFLYQRNRRTTEELARRGWRVLSEEQVLENGEEIVGHGPTVVTLWSNELSRARGGPRCMTMPLFRETL